MRDLIESFLKFVPQYLSNLIDITLSPKRFFFLRKLDSENALHEALKFFLFTFAFDRLWRLGILEIKDRLLVEHAQDIAIHLLVILISAVVVKVSWRIVGGKANIRSLLAASMYYSSVALLIDGFFKFFNVLVLMLYEPRLKEHTAKGDLNGAAEIISSIPPTGNLIASLFSLLGMLFLTIWFISFWGVFRTINEAGRLKSFAAACICVTLTLFSMWIGFFIFLGNAGQFSTLRFFLR